MSFPNFIGIGAQRCGTTWLDAQLRQHPEVYLPTRRKEIHFFDQFYDRGLGWYGKFFPEAGGSDLRKAIGEITPKYLFSPQAAARIYRDFPDARLIVILRNPADRAYSQYGLSIVKTGQAGGFRQFLEANPEAFYRGQYYDQLRRYFSRFPADRIRVLIFEEMMEAQQDALQGICRFLGIDPDVFSSVAIDSKVGESRRPRFATARGLATRFGSIAREADMDWAINAAKRMGVERLFGDRGRIPQIDPVIRAELLESYREDIGRLENLLGRSLSFWLENAPVPAGHATRGLG